MNTRPRRKILACCIGFACAAMAMQPAHADSAVGVDTFIGNVFNRGYADGPRDLDATPSKHTPTGQLYGVPHAKGEAVAGATSGWVEIGILSNGADEKAALFRKYKDPKGGLYLNSFGMTTESDNARFLDITGGGVGNDDQFYNLSVGRYNDWKVNVFYNETVHVYSSTFRSLYDGVGTGNQTLSAVATTAGLVPGSVVAGVSAYTVAQTQALAGAALRNTPDGEIGIVREKGGVRLDMGLMDSWKLYASYSNEKRVGARPFAVVAQATGGGAQSTELAEPIDYSTHDFLAGIRFADDLNAFNLSLSASYFRNNIGSLTYQNPWATANNSGITFANGGHASQTVDLYPDNDAYNLKAEYARSLPDLMNGRFTAVASLGSSRQNDALMPYTSNANLNAVAGVTAGTLWNTVASLSKPSAEARIDTQLIDLGLSLNPAEQLVVKGKLRSYQTENHTEFLNCNPNATYAGVVTTLTYMDCTGVWGRIAGDGSGVAILNPNAATLAPGGNQGYLSEPWDRKELIYGLSGDYSLNASTNLNAAYERESVKRRNRERAETWEDKVKLGYVNRSVFEDGSLRMSYEHGNKRGTVYDANPYDASLGGAIFAANGLAPSVGSNLATGWVGNRNTWGRKLDQADRDQDVLNLRFNYIFRPDLDGNASFQVKRSDYPDSRYGRLNDNQDSFNLDLNYQPSAKTSIYGFYSSQEAKMSSRGTAANNVGGGQIACTGTNGFSLALTGTGLPGDPLLCADPASGAASQWNPANNWDITHKDSSDTLGMGVKYDFSKAILDVTYTYAASRTRISYTGIGTSAAAALNGGGQFPDLTLTQNILEANVLVPINKQTSARVMLRHEQGRINDWHYTNLDQHFNPAVTSIMTDSGPQNYRTNVIGILLNIGL